MEKQAEELAPTEDLLPPDPKSEIVRTVNVRRCERENSCQIGKEEAAKTACQCGDTICRIGEACVGDDKTEVSPGLTCLPQPEKKKGNVLRKLSSSLAKISEFGRFLLDTRRF